VIMTLLMLIALAPVRRAFHYLQGEE